LPLTFLSLHSMGDVTRGLPGSNPACEKSSDTGSTIELDASVG
jgi:hypothetical protein